MNFDFYDWKDKMPSKDLNICEENFNLFFLTMFERQTIWKRRFIDKLERPWSDNKILNEYKFTNVYRELDKNSQYQIKNIILDDSLSLKNYVWKIMIFRIFNNPETFEFIKREFGESNGIPDFDEYNIDTFSRYIVEVRKNNINPFTSAYLINSAFSKEKRDIAYTSKVIPKIHNTINKIIKSCLIKETPEQLIKLLHEIPGVSYFISHEFYQDFTYIARYTDRNFFKLTQNDYTNVGPGASVGIRLIFPSLKNIKEQEQALIELKNSAEKELKKIGEFPYLHYNKQSKNYFVDNECNISLHQIEMWLCEFQKYWKMKNAAGKQRSKFTPSSMELL